MKDKKYSFPKASTKEYKKSDSFFPKENDLRTKFNQINSLNYNSISKLPPSNISIFCRFHPFNELEYLYSNKEGIKIKSSKNLLLEDEKSGKFIKEYEFNEIFEPNIHITSFYNKTCKNIINAVIQGYNGCIILSGERESYSNYILKEIIPQIIRQIYQNIYLNESDDELYSTEVSIYKIYHEKIISLMREDNCSKINNRKEENDKILYQSVSNEGDMEKIINFGINNKIGKSLNDEGIFVIEIKIYYLDRRKNLIKYGKLYLLELESLEEKNLNNNSLDLKKVKNDNNSLIHFLLRFLEAIVVHQKCDKNEESKTKYKKNKFSSILYDCFGGNSFTSLILTCSKSEYQIDKKNNLFKIAEEARKIKNYPLINIEFLSKINPFIQEIFKDNIKKLSKEPFNTKKNERIKNRYKNSNLIKYNFRYLLEGRENYKPDNNNKLLNDRYSNSDNKNKNQSLLKMISFSSNNKNRKKISDLFLCSNYYSSEISKYKNKIKELKLIIEESKNQKLELNSELNDKKADILMLKLEKEKLLNRVEVKLFENEEKILNLQKTIDSDKKKMENNLYSQIKNSEVIIREIINEKREKDDIINKYKNIINEYDMKIKELEMKYKLSIENNNQKKAEYELKINNYEMKVLNLTNENLIKDSLINKMKGEIQILKTELSSINSKNIQFNSKKDDNNDENQIIKNKEEEKKLLENYSSKIKELQNELNSVKLKKNKDESLLNHKLFRINELESKLKENKIIIDEYNDKYNLIDKELNDAKTSILNLQMEKANLIIEKNKELLSLEKSKNEIEFKNKELENELINLTKKIKELSIENENLKNKINNLSEKRNELDCSIEAGINDNFEK